MWAISDLHIGEKNKKYDDFHADKKLTEFLLSNPDKSLIGVGDIVELWQGDWRAIYESREELFDLLFSKLFYWVLGNHDEDIYKYRRHIPVEMCQYLILNSTIFLHGHQFDIFNSRYKSIGKAITQIAGKLENIHPNIDHWLSTLQDKVTAVGRYGDKRDYAKNAAAFAHGMKVDDRVITHVIMGHTHKKEVLQRKDILYQNSGTWIGEKQDITQF